MGWGGMPPPPPARQMKLEPAQSPVVGDPKVGQPIAAFGWPRTAVTFPSTARWLSLAVISLGIPCFDSWADYSAAPVFFSMDEHAWLDGIHQTGSRRTYRLGGHTGSAEQASWPTVRPDTGWPAGQLSGSFW